MEEITTMIKAEGWEFSEVPLEECQLKMQESYPKEVVKYCLSAYFSNDNGKGSIKGPKFSVLCASNILQQKKIWTLTDFEREWTKKLNDDFFSANLDFLKGMALVSGTGIKKISWFPASELPPDPANRFKVLFEKQSMWKYDEISPYLDTLTTPNIKKEQLLLQWSLETTKEGNVKVYCQKL